MCKIIESRVKLKPLEPIDVYEMRKWGRHDDPLFKDYNFPHFNDAEVMQWYNYRVTRKNSKCFSVYNEEDRMIGYINIRNIKKFKKTAELGIVFDPKVLNRGYGTEAIMSLLEYYFNTMNMKALHLSVAKFNKRAIRCYEKCGFKIIREYIKKHSTIFDEKYDKESHVWNKEYFTIKNNVIYCKYYEMRIQKEDFNK